jgi:general secretion pathway protein N
MLAGTVAGAVVFAPARWLAAALVWAGAPVQLHNAAGTLWNGSAQVLLQSGASGSTALPGALRWTLRPTWHAGSPGLRAEWNAECCLRGPWVWRIGANLQAAHLAVDDLHPQSGLRVPASLLTGLGTPWNTLAPSGELLLSTRDVSVRFDAGGAQMNGSVGLDALGISTSLSTLRPVGSYRVTLQGGESAHMTLSTLEGALQLSGTGTLRAQRFVFRGEASAAAGREDALSNLLNIIGQRQGARALIQLG